MARKSRTSLSLPVPADTTEANAVLFRLSELTRSVEAIESDFAQAVAQLRKEADEQIAPLATEGSQICKGLEVFADTNRATLLVGDEKTVKLSGGSFGWRWTPPKVSTGKAGDDKALATVKALDLPYVRTQEFLDKEALLRDRPVIAGIRYTQKELFFVEPEPAVDDVEASTNVVRLVVNG